MALKLKNANKTILLSLAFLTFTYGIYHVFSSVVGLTFPFVERHFHASEGMLFLFVSYLAYRVGELENR